MSWASNLDPEDNWDLCEGCQVVEFGGSLKAAKRAAAPAKVVAMEGRTTMGAQVDGESLIELLPPMLDLINIEIGGLIGEEHNLFLHGLELHGKGLLVLAIPVAIAPLLELININGNSQIVDSNSQVDGDTQVVNKIVDSLFCSEELVNNDSEHSDYG